MRLRLTVINDGPAARVVSDCLRMTAQTKDGMGSGLCKAGVFPSVPHLASAALPLPSHAVSPTIFIFARTHASVQWYDQGHTIINQTGWP